MAEDGDRLDCDGSTWGNTFPTPVKGRSRGRDEDCSELARPKFVNRSSYAEVGRMRRDGGRSFREGLMRHGGDASCPEVEDDPVAFEDMSSTVRARKRACTGEGCESILLSSETADRRVTETVEGDGVEGGRRIR